MKFFLFSLWLGVAAASNAFDPLRRATGPDTLVLSSLEKGGDRTIRFEVLASFNGDVSKLCSLIENPEVYREWLLIGINKKPSGGDYPFQIRDLTRATQEPNDSVWTLQFSLSTYLLSRNGSMNFRLSAQRCLQRWEVVPNKEAALEKFEADLTVVPSAGGAGRVWVRWNGMAQLRSSRPYERIPLEQLKQQGEERVRRAIENFQRVNK